MRRIFEEIGELVLEPQLWPQVLDRICSAANADGAMLVQGRSRTSGTPKTASMEESVRFYFDHGWHERDLLARGIPMLLGGEKAYVTQDVVSPDEMQNEAFFHEVLYRHRQRWSAVVRVAAGSALWCVSLHRSTRQNAFEADDRPFLESLSDRLTESATLSAMVGHVALTSSLNALELVRRPAIAIDRFGNVLESNAAAEAMFDDELRVHMRRLIVKDAKAQSDLTALFSRLRLSQDLAGVVFDTIIVRKKDRLPTFIRPVPIAGAAQSPFLGACALLIFADCSRREPPNAALLTRTFALSPSEARTAALLAKGLSIEESAQAAGLSRETIRSQVKTIFAKAGVRRQASLVLLLTSLPEL